MMVKQLVMMMILKMIAADNGLLADSVEQQQWWWADYMAATIGTWAYYIGWRYYSDYPVAMIADWQQPHGHSYDWQVMGDWTAR